MKFRFCPVCGSRYEYHRKTSQFCSAKCRAIAYRDDHPKPLRRSKVNENRRRTKLQNVDLKTCARCTTTFFVSGLNKCRKYCSNACKQAAYRDRKEAKHQEWLRSFEQQRQRRVELDRQRQGVMRLIGALQGAGK